MTITKSNPSTAVEVFSAEILALESEIAVLQELAANAISEPVRLSILISASRVECALAIRQTALALAELRV